MNNNFNFALPAVYLKQTWAPIDRSSGVEMSLALRRSCGQKSSPFYILLSPFGFRCWSGYSALWVNPEKSSRMPSDKSDLHSEWEKPQVSGCGRQRSEWPVVVFGVHDEALEWRMLRILQWFPPGKSTNSKKSRKLPLSCKELFIKETRTRVSIHNVARRASILPFLFQISRIKKRLIWCWPALGRKVQHTILERDSSWDRSNQESLRIRINKSPCKDLQSRTAESISFSHNFPY